MVHVGDIMSTVGVFSTVGVSRVPWGVQYRGEYHDTRAGYHDAYGRVS